MAEASGIMNMFLKGVEPPTSTGTLDLFMFATTGSGAFGGIDLYTFSDASGNIKTSSMNLTLLGSSSDVTTRTLNLWVGGVYPTISKSVSLTVFNGQSGVNDSINLFIRGSGVTDGALPFSSSLNLYIARGAADVLPLYLRAAGTPASGILDLSVLGSIVVSSGVDISLPNVVGVSTAFAQLYTHGN